MESDAIVENLGVLFKYLDDSRARVAELKKELEHKRLDTAFFTKRDARRIQDLEVEKEALTKQVAACKEQLKLKQESRQFLEFDKELLDQEVVLLREKLKVKEESRERLEPRVDELPNTVLSETRMAVMSERQLKVALEEKCLSLETRVKESAQLASTAMRERIEADKALEENRRECGVRAEKIQDLQRTYDELKTAYRATLSERDTLIKTRDRETQVHALNMGDLQQECDQLESANFVLAAEKNTLIKTCEALQSSNSVALAEKVSLAEAHNLATTKLRGKYDALKGDKKVWRAACTQFESKMETDKEELQQTLREMIELVGSIEKQSQGQGVNAQQELAEAQKRHRHYMGNLPVPPCNLGEQPEPVRLKERDLHAYLSEFQDPSWTSLSDRIVCLIGRVNISAKFHYVAYGPTSCYDRPTNKWIEGSDLASSHGGTRELFIGCKAGVEYVGSYRCHNLDALHPGGTQIPSNISASKILDIALGVRRPTEQVVRRRYLDGQIKVVATGLEYVGFNNQLYDFLRKRIADDRAELHDVTQLGKRKACDAGLRQGAKTKFRKTS